MKSIKLLLLLKICSLVQISKATCPLGYYWDFFTCKPCPKGTWIKGTVGKPCEPCAAGTYAPDIASISCIFCPQGEYQPSEGQSSCLKCDQGTYSTVKGATTSDYCQPCPKGEYQENEGQSSCSKCDQGTYSTVLGANNSNVCQACLKGEYQPYRGTSSCLRCNPGEFQNMTGQSKCKPCVAGEYSNAGSKSCTLCPIGEYQPNTGSGNCFKCKPGKFSNKRGATSCTNCTVGQYQDDVGQSTCERCWKGSYQDSKGSNTCTLCPVGAVSEVLGASSLADCKLCPKGEYQSEKGKTKCIKCNPGQYQNETGQQLCIPCEIGSYQDEEGQSQCKQCNMGDHINVKGSFECNECPYPLDNFKKGSHSCSVCRDGYYLVNGTIDTYSLHSKPREFCKECPLNATGTKCKAGTNLTDIPIMTGYWRASNSTSQIYKCNFEDNCKGTTMSSGRRLISNSTVLSGEYCKDGFTGALCEACNTTKQYFDNMDGKCKNCRISTFFFHLGISSVAIVFFASTIWTVKNRLTPLTITTSSLSIQAKMKILIGFYQIMSAFTDVYGANIHSDVKQIFYFVTYIISFEFLSSFPLDCLGTTTVAYVISGIWPYLMCIFFWICLKILKHARFCSNSYRIRKKTKAMANLDFSQVIVMIFYFALPIVSKHIFDAKICEAFKVDDVGSGSFESYLLSSRAIQCDMKKDSRFRELQFCFWIFFLLWPCFTLLGFAALVAKVFTSVRVERPSALAMKCQFLWRDFDPTSNIAIYWDIIDFTRKLFLIGFINFVDQKEGSNKLLRLTIATAVSSAFMLILLYVRPYRRSDDFKLAVVSSFLITLAFCLGYILQICENEESACEKYIATGIDDHLGASILVTILMIAMLIIAFLALIIQTRISPILRLKSTRHPPNLYLPEECTHHVFMSHRWEGGQDKCHSIARKLQLYMPGLKVWLDVDNLSNTSELEDSVNSSVVFLLSYSFGYFESPNCRREFYQALFLDKPIVLVYSDDSFPLKVVKAYGSEMNPRDGNIYFELMKKECTKFCLPPEEGEEHKSNIDFEKEIIQILEKSEVPECDFASKVAEMRDKVELFISKIHQNDNTSDQGETKSTLLQVEDNANAGYYSETSEQGNGYSSLSQEVYNNNDDSGALAIQWLKTGSFSSESLKLIYLRILRALPYYSDDSVLLLRKGLKLPNDEKTPKLKFQVEVLFSSLNKGVQNIADEIKSLNSQSIAIIDLSKNEEKNDEENPNISLVTKENFQDAVVKESEKLKESEVEPFLVTPPGNDDIVCESSSNSLPSCFSLESIGLSHEQDASEEPSSMNHQSMEENKVTSSFVKNPQITSSIVEHNHALLRSTENQSSHRISGLEPFTIQSINSEKVEENYETWFGIVPGCFRLEDLPLEESKKSETFRNPQEVTDYIEKGQILTDTPLRMNQESRRLLRSQLESKNFKVFLLYLNKDTFAERTIAKLGPILQSIIEQKIPIIAVHEQDHKKGAEPNFDYFLENTPQQFMSVYQDIATPIYTQKEYRHVSLCCIIKKIIEKHDELE